MKQDVSYGEIMPICLGKDVLLLLSCLMKMNIAMHQILKLAVYLHCDRSQQQITI
jgi:hypothetical protein